MMPEQKIHIIHLIGIAGFIFLYAMIECMGIYASCFNKMCLHTSRLTGDQWVQELINGHEERSSKDEAIPIETLIKQKLAGNWGDNNPKKLAWTACETALADTGKSGAVQKSLNVIKNHWQRVSLLSLRYMCIAHSLL
jgi:hypothetical protein